MREPRRAAIKVDCMRLIAVRHTTAKVTSQVDARCCRGEVGTVEKSRPAYVYTDDPSPSLAEDVQKLAFRL